MRTLRYSLALAVAGAIVALGVLDARQDTVPAAEIASAQTGAAVSAMAPYTVDLAAVPEFTAAQGAPIAAPSPRVGVPEAVYRARKALAAQTSPSYAGESIGDAPAASGSSDVELQTPGATKSFEGMNLSQCGFIPSD